MNSVSREKSSDPSFQQRVAGHVSERENLCGSGGKFCACQRQHVKTASTGSNALQTVVTVILPSWYSPRWSEEGQAADFHLCRQCYEDCQRLIGNNRE